MFECKSLLCTFVNVWLQNYLSDEECNTLERVHVGMYTPARVTRITGQAKGLLVLIRSISPVCTGFSESMTAPHPNPPSLLHVPPITAFHWRENGSLLFLLWWEPPLMCNWHWSWARSSLQGKVSIHLPHSESTLGWIVSERWRFNWCGDLLFVLSIGHFVYS